MAFVCLIYPSLKTFYSLFQTAFLLLLSLTATRFSSRDTPATASCKEKLLIALCDSLLIVLLNLWEQNILLLDEEWVGRLLALWIFHHWLVERNVWCSRSWNFIAISISTFISRFVHSMACDFMILECESVTGKGSSFYNWVYWSFHCCWCTISRPEQLAHCEDRNNQTRTAA